MGYADRYDTIFYISNGIIARAEGYNWKGIVPGDIKNSLWTEFHDIEDLPQVIQPKGLYMMQITLHLNQRQLMKTLRKKIIVRE